MMTNIAIALLGLIAVLLGLAMGKPDVFRVERRKRIQAPAEAIYAYLNDLQAFRRWSPWEEKDPNMTASHSGTESGVGAVFAWDGDKNVGKGRMEIIAAEPNERVEIKLDFLKPFEAHNIVEFLLEEADCQTTVAWVMTGSNTFFSKIMSVFVSMDKMVGPDFEAGLNKLQQLVEAETAA
ncbi:MAG TPA: polyketide cyclase [Gammaproteobacteria bacterium]|nr:polyketide cyclase [Gammaproteobacteria bacterium]